MKKGSHLFVYLLVLLNLITGLPIFAMSSQNYQISQDSINFAGADDGKSANYRLEDTAGEIGSGPLDTLSYSIEAGFRQMEEESPYFRFSVAAANQATRVVYTNFATTTVTLSAAANFAANDYIAVSENEGTDQKVAVGRVLSVAGNVVTVDFWTGDSAAISGTPAGIDDFAYELSGNAFDMGVLSSLQINSGLSFYDVTASARNGYSVSVYANHALITSTGVSLASVSDNAVSVGAGEYGIRTTGDDIATSTIDFSVLTTPQVIASSSKRSELRRSVIIYKASGSNYLSAGHYTQSISYIATLNF